MKGRRWSSTTALGAGLGVGAVVTMLAACAWRQFRRGNAAGDDGLRELVTATAGQRPGRNASGPDAAWPVLRFPGAVAD